MKPCFFAALAGLAMLGGAMARTWTNADGRTLEAEYISSDGTHVVFKMGEKEVTYPLSKLSQADQDWVAEQNAPPEEEAEPPMDETPDTPPAEPEPDLPPPPPTGYRVGQPIDQPLHDDTAEYFATGTPQRVFEALKEGAFPEQNPGKADDWIARGDQQATYRLYVPGDYDGSQEFGLYLHLPSGSEGDIPEAWRPEMDARHLIGLSIDQAGDDQPMLRRAMLAVDAITTVAATYKLDPARRIIGGSGPAAHAAMLTAAIFPAEFTAVISQGSVQAMPLTGNDGGGFPGMAKRNFLNRPLAYVKWVAIVAKDDDDLPEATRLAAEWEHEGLDFKLIESPAGSGETAPAKDFAEAIKWIEEP
ncbi:hypothetical protein [Haloferula sargassicola]|uniref:SLA1 homology domain-containing protein n=1 Tax=Haloferula sargassicola TaxID=490096 RepID=A0ABP9UN18_9BACT